MRFTVLGHACMLVEANGVTLLTDPWLVGSCYWRSWWNFPKAHMVDLSRVDYVYLTHHHWDHFHGPTLRRLPASATIVVPQAPTPHMVDDLREFGFARVVEVPHGGRLRLPNGVCLTSYHYAPSLDSALVIDDGKTVLLDMNDCKLAGRTLRQVVTRHPRVDFLFRSHSSASPYPHNLDATDPADLLLRQNTDYLADFVRTAKVVRPRYAVPFASNACFLHRESVTDNAHAVSPLDVKAFFDASPSVAETKAVVMLPGSTWDRDAGFSLSPHDPFDHRAAHLAAYADEVAPALARRYAEEDAVQVQFAAFERYFSRLFASLPPLFGRVFRPVVVFAPTLGPPRYWAADFAARTTSESSTPPERCDILIRVHPAILRDCLTRKMFTVLWPSKRLRVRLGGDALRDFFLLIELLPLYDQGYFPLRRNLTWRFVRTLAPRWREGLDYLGMLWRMTRARDARRALAEAVPRV